MEALCIHPFEAEDISELSFAKGDTIKILDLSDENWYKAELNGRVGYVPNNRVKIRPHAWFEGKMTREASNAYLRTYGDNGTFLVRESETCPGDFSLSVKHERKVHHFRIMRTEQFQYYLYQEQLYSSINQLVNAYSLVSPSRVIDTILLRKPLVAIMDKDVRQNNKSKRMLVAQFDFNAEDDEELGFQSGDKIEFVMENDEHWWIGRNSQGRQGMFPACYCRELINAAS